MTTLDRKIAVLEGKAKYSARKASNDREMALTQIRADRYTFMNDCQSVDTTTSANWGTVKARLDKEWLELSTLVDRS
jgi:hypothetical protein